MKIVDVIVIDQSTDEEIVLVASVLNDENKEQITVKYFSRTRKKYEDLPLYRFDEETNVISEECISGHYEETTQLEDLGYVKISDEKGYICPDDDETDDEYDPNDEYSDDN